MKSARAPFSKNFGKIVAPSGSNVNPRFRTARGVSKQANLSPVVPNGPIDPQTALHNYSKILIPYERSEIQKFPEIYYVGKRQAKIPTVRFDDLNAHYRISIGDHLAYRYEIIKKFGAGAFGQVIQAYDHKMKKMVAVKILVNTKQMHEQGHIEAKILSVLNHNHVPNVVEAYDLFVFRSHVCITFEILGRNLYEVLSIGQFKGINIRTVRSFALQMFTTLADFAKLDIAHCDMKPENVLLTDEENIKIIDYGSSCFVQEQMYEYIQSRYYRAPEVILGIDYGPAMDVWSTALIVVELITGKPLFPGESELEQLHLLAEILGTPPRGLVRKGRRKAEFFTEELRLKKFSKGARKPGTRKLQSVLGPIGDPYVVDFLSKCLTWDQNLRMTAAQALRHPFLQMKEIKLKDRFNCESLPVLNVHAEVQLCKT